MSSFTLSFDRKRRSDDESSETSSSDDSPPIKRLRTCYNRQTIFTYFAEISDIVATKCKSIMRWMSEMPFGKSLKESMLQKFLNQQPLETVVLDETDEENQEQEVVEIKDDDSDPNSVMEVTQQHLNKDSFRLPTRPFSMSTPYYQEQQMRCSESKHLRQKPVNGYHSQPSWKSKEYQHRKARSQRTGAEHRIAPLTNPATDIEILLDTRETSIDDSDDLKVLSETSNQSNKLSSRISSTSYGGSRNSEMFHVNNMAAMANGKTSTPYSKRERNQPSSSYTALEVVRLQERDQYKLLLEKMMNKSFYHPVMKQDSKPMEIQVDSSDDDEPVIVASPFKKEVLRQPVDDFFKKYYKPCQLVCPVPPPSASELEKIDDAIACDDEIQVVKEVNEYKPKPKKRPDFFSPDWINDLKMTINAETESRIQIVKEQEDKIERFKKRRDAKLADEMRLRDKLKLSGILTDVSFEEEAEFPDLTPEMEREIDLALDQNRATTELLSELPERKVRVSRLDIFTLAGLNWLNDEIINFYLALIVERSTNNNGYPKVYTYNSFFYSSLKTRGPQRVLRWTKNDDVFAHDLLLVPLHLGVHWALCVIDNRSKSIKYYDSMRSSEENCLKLLQNYVVSEMKDKKNTVIEINTYSTEVAKDIPLQMNGSDCGMFTLKYAEYISRDAPVTFTQANMHYFRRKMVYEIIHKQLM